MWAELVACAERGGSSESELIEKINAGHSLLWPIEGGCLVIDRAEDGAAVAWLGVGRGKLRELAKQESKIAEVARADGCTKLRIHGRKGWERVFRHWEVIKREGNEIVMERAL